VVKTIGEQSGGRLGCRLDALEAADVEVDQVEPVVCVVGLERLEAGRGSRVTGRSNDDGVLLLELVI